MSSIAGAVHKIAIVGAGSIGVAWAIVFARTGLSVSLYDVSPDRLAAATTEIRQRLADLSEFALIDEPVDRIAGRVSVTADLDGATRTADYVQECAPEQVDLKRALFSELESLAPEGAVLASSSSAVTASLFAGHLRSRARCLVVHPGNPPYLLPIAEIVPADFTDRAVVARTKNLLTAVGMVPIVLQREVEGFVFNRLQGAMLREAYCLVRDGVISVDELDRAVREGLGLRWAFLGPFETVDLNTRGGIGVHAQRMGPVYERLGAERGQHDPWTGDLVAKVVTERRALLPIDRWEERTVWRDRRLMALVRLKRCLDAAENVPRKNPSQSC